MPITTLPNPGMDFTPLTPLTAEEMDDIVENIEAINNATIQTGSIADGAITKAKLGADAMSNQNYSTNEIDTGTTWIDGKKIYKKTFHKNIASATRNDAYTIPLGISNLDMPVKIEGVRKRSSTTYPEICVIPFYLHYSGSDAIYIDVALYLDSNELSVTCKLGTGYGGVVDDFITFYYTKTS